MNNFINSSLIVLTMIYFKCWPTAFRTAQIQPSAIGYRLYHCGRFTLPTDNQPVGQLPALLLKNPRKSLASPAKTPPALGAL